MIKMKNLVYTLTCLSISVIIGGAVFEHLAIWPIAYSAPPASLSMFQGDYGLNAGAFWSLIHPATLLLFIITLILFWKYKRRKNIVIAFVGYLVIMVTTFLYFVPELIAIITTTYADTIDPALVSRGQLWEQLSLLRLALLIVLAIILFLGLTKPAMRHIEKY